MLSEEWVSSHIQLLCIPETSQACCCLTDTAAGPLEQLAEEMKMWWTHILHTLASCHLTFTSPNFTQRGTLGRCQIRDSNVRSSGIAAALLPGSEPCVICD
ncbi:hypothetical protein ATANTOWER_010451 [Ataeniobius toweri]|uniref:Uncharacterized protein n=1 Tax=Ataeniobius toweri TaxID=208326 RepID=A0ABU7BK00_9TELE|nr:hypothetical protein [Ataeniobius toweri]